MPAPGEAIVDRIREVVQGAAGAFRTIDEGTYLGELYEGLDDVTKSARAAHKPRAEATIVSGEPSASTPDMTHSLALEEIEVEVRLVRHLGTNALVGDGGDAIRARAKGLAYADASVLRQALGWPGNLTATEAGTPTGLVSGLLQWVRTSVVRVQLSADNRPGLIETVHTFRGTVKVTQATS